MEFFLYLKKLANVCPGENELYGNKFKIDLA
jgi:hypothetical protein